MVQVGRAGRVGKAPNGKLPASCTVTHKIGQTSTCCVGECGSQPQTPGQLFGNQIALFLGRAGDLLYGNTRSRCPAALWYSHRSPPRAPAGGCVQPRAHRAAGHAHGDHQEAAHALHHEVRGGDQRGALHLLGGCGGRSEGCSAPGGVRARQVGLVPRKRAFRPCVWSTMRSGLGRKPSWSSPPLWQNGNTLAR